MTTNYLIGFKNQKQFAGKVLIENGEDPREYENIDSCLSDILLSSKRGLNVQRYKGLGNESRSIMGNNT